MTGHSLVSGLYREGDDIVLRLWNPLEAETVTVTAAGLEITETNLEGRSLATLGTGRAELEVGAMQIKTLRLSAT